MTGEPTVFVIDDDQTMRGSLRWLLESMKLNVEAYASARDFLSAYDPARPGCLLLDVRMPEISGLQLQDILAQRQIRMPVIMISGHGDVPVAVRAMKAGALDFIEKPFNDETLLERVQEALATDTLQRRQEAERRTVHARLALLTPREREVLDKVVDGKPNKTIAAVLGISVKTVEAHRAKVMEKMAAHTAADLSAMYYNAGLHRGKP